MRRIAICAPGKRLEREAADRVQDLAQADPEIELVFHRQCFARHGHFAGDDATRLAAFVECANDPDIDGVWFASGGYGSNRIADDAIGKLTESAKSKTFLGYSDTGYLLSALAKAGVGRPAHGPMVSDIARSDGETAIKRALAWLKGESSGLEPSVGANPTAAFNLTTLAMLVGTDLALDLTGHEVMVEEVSEHLYAIDRLFFHLSQHLSGIAGLRLGRVSQVPENDRPFGASPEDIARHWCEKAGIPYLGFADIGHDASNTIVPFGLARTAYAE